MKLASDYFDEIWKEYINTRHGLYASETEAKYFFVQGRRSAQSEKSKRTIAEVTSNANGQWIVRSNDGKLYLIHGFDPNGLPQWLPYPDLPQD